MSKTLSNLVAHDNFNNLLSSSLMNEDGPQSPRCCGSTTSNADVTKVGTGKFERKCSGGSFKVIITTSS